MDFIELEILNWSKHQPRKDIKHPTWFAMSNRIMEDAKLFGLSAEEWQALLYIFCQASQQNNAKVKINFAHAERVCSIKKKSMLSTISRLCDVDVTRAYGDVTQTSRDTTLQDTTDKTGQDTARAPRAVRKAPTEPTKANAFVRMYCEAFKTRWGENPQILGKDAGIAKRLAKDLSPDRFAYLLEAYFAMPDAWLVKTKHPLGAFETKLNEVVIFAEQGNFTTQTQVRQADQMATNHLLMEKLKREGK